LQTEMVVSCSDPPKHKSNQLLFAYNAQNVNKNFLVLE
jgi:hypothetical protein